MSNSGLEEEAGYTEMALSTGQVAIIGMSGRFPGAPNVERFWANLVAGVESITFFSEEQLLSAGLPIQQIKDAKYVPAKGVLEGACDFDIDAFDFTMREAGVMDPQFRVFLETALEALEDAGYAGDDSHRVGVYAGAGANTYHEFLRREPGLLEQLGLSQITTANQVDFLSAWVSYKLNLTGPSVTVQSACSTSLAAVHLAAQSLLNGECDIALAGGVSLIFPQETGYYYVEGGLFSRDGHCRAFDSKATGFVPGEGVGAVVLRRLEDAIATGDTIHALIKGTAINNDGNLKIGFTSPSLDGMAAAIVEGIDISGDSCENIGMVEAHGTGTILGDPLEVAALTKAFRLQTEKKQFCALGSVKTNIGHANAAAGIAGLIKATLSVRNGLIPPTLNCDHPNPVINFSQTPFYVNSKLETWPDGQTLRRAAVNSFGIGGANAHVVIEQAPPRKASGPSRRDQTLVLSAKTPSALAKTTSQLAAYLDSPTVAPLPDVAFTLALGRRTLEHRRVILCQSREEAIDALQGRRPERVVTRWEEGRPRRLTLLFPDSEAGYSDAIAELYRVEAGFRDAMDRCAEAVQELRGQNIRELLFSSPDSFDALRREGIASAIAVAGQYSLAKLLMDWGLTPYAFIGCGIGNLAAQAAAGTLSIKAALSTALGDSAQKRQSEMATEERLNIKLDLTSDSDRFREMALSVLRLPDQALVDLSDGQVLKRLDLDLSQEDQITVSALRHHADYLSACQWLSKVLGELWAANTPVDWRKYYSVEERHRVPLPTYPFEQRRCWFDSWKLDSMEGTQPQPQVGKSGRHDAPQNDLQRVVASIWAFYLGVESVGLHDSFFELGGNSILATRIVSALRDTLQIDLPLRTLLENPTVFVTSEVIEKSAQEWDVDIHEVARMVWTIQQTPIEMEPPSVLETGQSPA
ncbi:MAG: phosphopantetheine-binding protein [Acidobacteria bacterium]|nr:phosphopantetheine-binding protein [Acidobacteriota bacterium]